MNTAHGGAAPEDVKRDRVLFVGINYAPEPTGIAPYTTGMAEALVERGWRVRAITTHPHYPAWRVQEGYGGWKRRQRIGDVDVLRLAHYVPTRHSFVTRALSEMTFGLRAITSRWNRPDVVAVVSPALISSRLVALKAKLLGIPTIVWIQDIYTLGVQETQNRARGVQFIAKVERNLANESSGVVVIHDRFATALRETLSVTTPITVVRNWSHVSTETNRRSEATRRRLGWADDDVVVLHAGNMGAKQGLGNVVRAAAEAERRNSRIRFVLMGDGNQRSELEAMQRSSRLQFIDPLPSGEFEDALASADVLLVNELPGLREMAVPSKLTTYFATGLPVVAAVDERSITRDEMLASGAGPWVPAGDPIALVDAVERLAKDHDAARAYGSAGLRYRERHLGITAAADAFENTLRSATSS